MEHKDQDEHDGRDSLRRPSRKDHDGAGDEDDERLPSPTPLRENGSRRDPLGGGPPSSAAPGPVRIARVVLDYLNDPIEPDITLESGVERGRNGL